MNPDEIEYIAVAWLGFELEALTEELREEYGLDARAEARRVLAELWPTIGALLVDEYRYTPVDGDPMIDSTICPTCGAEREWVECDELGCEDDDADVIISTQYYVATPWYP